MRAPQHKQIILTGVKAYSILKLKTKHPPQKKKKSYSNKIKFPSDF